MIRKIISWVLLVLAVPSVIIGGSVIFRSRGYTWLILCVALLTCLAFFVSYERRQSGSKLTVLIAVMIAATTVSRALFAWAPGIKPVTALVVITGLYFGSQAGFMTGALTALISNLYFSQGAWTPFQMLAWGMVGFVAGLLATPLKKHRWLLPIFGVLTAIIYSLVVNLSIIAIDGGFNPSRYGLMFISSINATIGYVFADVIFLMLLYPPLSRIFSRIKTKYDF